MMRQRRFERWTMHRVWAGVWIVIVVLGALFLATQIEKANAYDGYYDYEQPYPGWHADMEQQQQEQNRLLQEDLDLQHQQRRRQWLEDSRRRARDHSEDLRTNWGHGW